MGKKSEQVLKYIKSIKIGEAISVRSLAQYLQVSEGTAYRAIKEAEKLGIVATIPRVGTVRTSQDIKDETPLTFADIIPMIDGTVYSGESGLNQPLEQFMIGAMEEKTALQYMRKNALLIVGNREYIQKEGLESGMAVLITGGFRPSKSLVRLSQKVNRPVIGTDYDSFTVATMINKALGEQMIKKDIICIRDVKLPFSKMVYLHQEDTIRMYFKCISELSHDVIPIVDRQQRLVGIVTHREVQGQDLDLPLEKVMKKSVASVNNNTNIASVVHLMIWDNYHYLPVVKENGILDGLVSRYDIMEAMEAGPLLSSDTKTFSEEVGETLTEQAPCMLPLEEEPVFSMKITPPMIHRDGTLAFGVLTELLISVIRRFLDRKHRNYRFTIEQLMIDYMEIAQLDNRLTFYPRLLDERRLMAKIEIDIYNDKKQLVAQAKVVCHLLSELEQ